MASIWDTLDSAAGNPARALCAANACVPFADLRGATSLSVPAADLQGRSVLLSTRTQLAAALALIELDGIARRIVIATPDLAREHLPEVAGKAEVDAIASDDDRDIMDAVGRAGRSVTRVAIAADGRLESRRPPTLERGATEWILLTSGTSGAPKLVAHTLASLTAAIAGLPSSAADIVWGTFYDMRRYGGLQMFLRAVWCGASFVLSDASESGAAFLARLSGRKATHVSGTPSHWRRALMTAAASSINPRYVRLSGEIADQAILSSLRAQYPDAVVAHAYASTEAGVGFEVEDGLAGFPARFIGGLSTVDLKVIDGSLRLRSQGIAARYLGESRAVADEDGFVDTGDAVELRGDRYYFLGRRSGMINVGGLKVYPEEIESAINRHPSVRMSLVRSRHNPIMGAVVAADVVLKPDVDATPGKADEVKREILRLCHDSLPAHKVPATITFVTDLNVAAAGKLARAGAPQPKSA